MTSMTTIYSGINPDGSLKKFSTPIPTTDSAKAAALGDISALEKMSYQDIFAIDEYGNTPLIWAADTGCYQIVSYILSIISEGDDEDNQSTYLNKRGYLGNTALARASRGGHVTCVSALISHRLIDPNICNEKMQYPLHFGAFKKHINVVDVLLTSGKCDTYVKDRKGRTPSEDTSVEDIKTMIYRYREDKQNLK